MIEENIKKAEIEISPLPREEGATDWELEIKDILAYFSAIIKGYYFVIDNEGNLVIKKGEELANDKLIQLINYKLLSYNKFTALSHTNENEVKKLVYFKLLLLAEEVIFNKEDFNIKSLERVLNLLSDLAEYSYHSALKSVGGGERIYRGKVVERKELIKPKQQSYLKKLIPFI